MAVKKAVVRGTASLQQLQAGDIMGDVRVTAVTALTPGTTVSVDASLGNTFTLVPAQNFTLSNPTNPTNGQMLLFRIKQDGTGSRVMTLDTKFRLSADITAATLSTGANKVDYMLCYYDSTDDKFDVISIEHGH